MIYVFDTNSLRSLSYYYPSRFPTFWEKFNDLVSDGTIISVRDARREIDYQARADHLREWLKENRSIFLMPEPEETRFVAHLFNEHERFQDLVRRKNIQRGSPVADPFIVASAYVREGCVVTEEKYKENAVSIPNVCEHYGIDCTSLEGFMEKEDWVF